MTYAIPAGMASLKLPHHVPVDRVRGRDALLAQLTAALDASGVHVLHGMGGAGKTTVAQRLAPSFQQRKIDVWWVNATVLQTGMHMVARAVGATQEELTQQWAGLVARSVRGHLASLRTAIR